MASHSLDEDRTRDVHLDRDYTFEHMLLPEPILRGLSEAGYIHPSLIQKKGIPIGRCGYDMLVQSKSGTGKTLVFSIIAMEKFNPDIAMPQTLILSPTREIAVQTGDTLKALGKYIPNFKTEVIIGGLSLQDNRKALQGCSVVVATPGRILHLIELNVLNTKQINLLILDEIDLLTELNFNLDKILSVLDRKRLQVITVSATLDKNTQEEVTKFMRNPIGITPAKEVPVLVGIGQFVCRLPENEPGLEMLRKFAKLKEILSQITFKQCFVFTNSQSLAESYKKLLSQEDWPSEVITGAYEQSQRLTVLRKLKEFKIRVLLSTDLMARGIDAENVNLVVNMDVPRNGMVYLHRIGRAGRFGTKGVAITLVATEEQRKQFDGIQEQFGMQSWVMELPEKIESKEVWEMVDRERNEVVIGKGEENGDDEEDALSLLLDSSSLIEKKSDKKEKQAMTNKKEEVEEEEDPLSLLLDSSSLIDKKADKKETTKICNILDEFDQFSESEIVQGNVPKKDKDTDSVIANESLEDNVDSTEEEDDKMDDIDMIRKDLKSNIKIKDQENKERIKKKNNKCDQSKQENFNKWHTMFHAQSALIMDFVERNREAQKSFADYYHNN